MLYVLVTYVEHTLESEVHATRESAESSLMEYFLHIYGDDVDAPRGYHPPAISEYVGGIGDSFVWDIQEHKAVCNRLEAA